MNQNLKPLKTQNTATGLHVLLVDVYTQRWPTERWSTWAGSVSLGWWSLVLGVSRAGWVLELVVSGAGLLSLVLRVGVALGCCCVVVLF